MATRRVFRQASPTEMIYIATGTIVVSRSRIDGAVRREQFAKAVAYLEARYGILRSVVVDGYFVERMAGQRLRPGCRRIRPVPMLPMPIC